MYQIFGKAGYVHLQFWTHKIGGLHKNDFIMAAKTDELFEPVQWYSASICAFCLQHAICK